MDQESLIVYGLLFRREYARKVLPYLRSEYFMDRGPRVLFEVILDYAIDYKKYPTIETVGIEVSNKKGLSSDDFEEALEVLSKAQEPTSDIEWMIDNAEKFCRDRALQLAVFKAADILRDQGTNKKGGMTPEAIPAMVSEALAVSFQSGLGHDYVEDRRARWELYHDPSAKVPFRLEYLNKITKGGLKNKTMMLIMGATGFGKSMWMCHLAADNLLDGKNVLYITLEMSEEETAKRLDANLLDINYSEVEDMPWEEFDSRFGKMLDRLKGRVGKVIIEDMTGCNANQFRAFINDLKLKKGFEPDIIYVDYLNLASSVKMRGSEDNSYAANKSKAEEIRALGKEFDCPVVTATQVNRSGFSSSDPDLDNTADSFGIPMTADLFLAIVNNDEFVADNQQMVIQLKNRYHSMYDPKKFMIGADRTRQRLFDLEGDAQKVLYNTEGDVKDKKPAKGDKEKVDRPRPKSRSAKPKIGSDKVFT